MDGSLFASAGIQGDLGLPGVSGIELKCNVGKKKNHSEAGNHDLIPS